MKREWVIPTILVLIFLPMACSEDDDNGGGDGSAAVSFTAANANSAAAMFASTVSPFVEASLAGLAVVQAAETAAGGLATGGVTAGTARDLVELGDLGLCDTGQSIGTWDDRDGDQTLSAGDVLEVTFMACDDVTSASLTLMLEDVGYALTTAAAVLEATFVDVDRAAAATSGLFGAFRVEMNRVPEPPLFICRLLVSAQNDPLQRLILTSDDVAVLEVGCFNLYFTFELDGGGFTLSEPLAVFRIPDAGIMSIESWGLPALTFPDRETPEAGQVRFVAYSFATPCAALGVPGDGIDSNESYLVLTATGGGNVTLVGQAADGAPIAVETTWDQLD
jgi:hypothetical protein